MRFVMVLRDRRRAVKLFKICAMLTVTSLMASCETTTAIGNSGCVAYGEARTTLPRDTDALDDTWLRWVVTTDTRMTAVCR